MATLSAEIRLHSIATKIRKKGLKIEPQKAIQVIDEDGTVLGNYFEDL
jgi:hypothetical protein